MKLRSIGLAVCVLVSSLVLALSGTASAQTRLPAELPAAEPVFTNKPRFRIPFRYIHQVGGHPFFGDFVFGTGNTFGAVAPFF